MRLSTGYEERKARIELIPLLDVIFLLLASFIYATLALTASRGIRVDLPRGEGSSNDVGPVVISIDSRGALWMDGQSLTMEVAVGRAAARSREREEMVLISGDRSAGLGVAVELLSALKQADVRRVSFQVREEP